MAALPLAAGAAPAAAGGAVSGGAAAGGGSASGMALSLLNDFIAALAAAGVTSAISPPAIPSAAPDTSGKYFIGPETDVRLIPDYRADVFRTRLLNSLGFDLDMPRSPQEILAEVESRVERQARSLTEREIAKRSYELANELAMEKLARDAEVRRAQIQSTGDLRRQEVMSAADVRGRELESLGRTQAERLKSSYGMAGDVLTNAIENVLRSGVINDRSAQVELAKIQ